MKKKDLTYHQANRLYNLPRLGDYDKDKVINMFDCRPFDKNRDGLFGRTAGILSGGRFGQSKEEYEQEKIEKAQAQLERNKMPREPVYEDTYKPKAAEPKPKKTEPYVLYIKHSLTDPYVMVGQFDSSADAHRYLNENYKGFAHKIMSVKDAIKEGEKQEERKKKRKEMVTKSAQTVIKGIETIGKGAVAVGKGVAKASEAVGEAEEKYKEYWERRDVKAFEREEQDLERLRRANERMYLRMEQEELREEQRAKMEQLKAEAREKERERERYERPQSFGSGFRPPQRQSGFTFNPPSPLTPQRPIGGGGFGGQQKPSGFTFQAPRDIRWKPYQPPAQPAKKKSKKKKGGK